MKNYTITVNGKVYEVTVEEGFRGENKAVSAPSSTSSAPKKTAAPAPKAAPVEGTTEVKAPMPGKIIDVKVQTGQAVKKGDVLMILEAMKMENEIVAPEDGTVAGIQVTAGTAVEAGDILAALN